MKHSRNSAFNALTTICLVGSFALTSTQAIAASWLYDVKVSKVSVQPNKFVQVRISGGDVPTVTGCGNDSKTMELSPSSPQYEQQYALVLAALVSQRNVSFYVDGCANALPLANHTSISAE